MKKTINVLITGLTGGGFGEQCLQALSLSKLNYKIIGTNMEPLSSGLFMVDKGYIVPPASSENYIPELLKICRKENVVVLIPGSEPELKRLVEQRQEFEKDGIRVLANNKNVIDICTDKWRTYEFLRSNDFKVPRTWIVQGGDLKEINCRYPIIIKPYRGSGGSKNVFLAQDEEELRFFVKYLDKQGLSIIAQEYIGLAEEEYTVSVLSDESGNILNSIALKRIVKSSLSKAFSVKGHDGKSEYIVSSGVSQGRIDAYKVIRQNAEMIACRLGSTGPLNVQCRLVGDNVYTFEINPRFSGTTSIRALCGFNEPDLLIRKYVLKQNVKKVTYKKGLILRGLFNYFISDKKFNTLNKNKFIKNKK